MGTIYKNSINYSGGGDSLPDGGTTGQALVKKSDVDQDVEWKDVGADKTYEFTQATPSDEWQITHTLDKFPSVTIVDSAGSVVIGDIQYVSKTQIVITFQAPFAGKAYLN